MKCKCNWIDIDEVVYFPEEDRFRCERCEKQIHSSTFGKLQMEQNAR